MEIENKEKELSNLIEGYFKSQISIERLFEYSWETIDFYEKNQKSLSPYQEEEKVFWYTIWQLQHLSDEEHEENGSLTRALLEIIEYLKNQKSLPKNYEGKRP